MSHTQIFDLSSTALCYLVIKFLIFKIFQKTQRGMRSNKVTATELTHVKWINKYLLFRPHISVEYNNISVLSREGVWSRSGLTEAEARKLRLAQFPQFGCFQP